MPSFLGSIAPAALLEILGQGGSTVAFNWWLRAATVNNLSVVLVSDIFYSIFFGAIAMILIIRLTKKWNEAMLRRVGTITLHQSTPRHHTTSDDDNSNNNNINVDDENENEATRTSRPTPVVDDIAVSVKEISFVLKSHFFNSAAAVGWLVLAGTCDCLLSLCETYAAGHIAVITQLFLKASEPIVTWLFALKWRRSEHASPVVNNNKSKTDEKSALIDNENHQTTNYGLENTNEDEIEVTMNDVQQTQQDEKCCSSSNFLLLPAFFTSISSRRMILSLISLFCVGLGISLHFALNIRNEVESGKHDQNPVGFVLMYVCSIFGSALYSISFGRYIFLVRRFAVHTDPLDVVDLYRGATHSRITEHHVENNKNNVNQENENENENHHVPSASFADENIQQYDGAEYNNQRGSLLDGEEDDPNHTDNINVSPSRSHQQQDDTRQSIQSFATSSHSRSRFHHQNNNEVSDSSKDDDDHDQEHHLAILEKNKCSHGISSTDVRVIACTLEVTISLLLSCFLAPCFELMPGGVGAAKSWSDLESQTWDGVKALAAKSTLLYAGITLLGWTFVYAADSVLNHLSAPLTALINQLASPMTAIVLMVFPILDASATPEAKKLPEFSFGLQLVMKIGSCVMVFIGSIFMYGAEKNHAD